MNAIIKINEAYIEAKGKTFFAAEPFLDNPRSHDGFINDTLEHLRQSARSGVIRGDEQQIEQTLLAMSGLVRAYLKIDYANPHASKTHAHLAASYLSSEVERIVPHNMPDVLMESIRLIGKCAIVLLAVEGPQGIMTLVQKIGHVSCVGLTRENYRPVTITGVEQLALLSLNLLLTQPQKAGLNVRLAAREIRANIKLIAKLLMTLTDTPLARIHSTHLAPYYSTASLQGLAVQLSNLLNAAIDALADDVRTQQFIDNFSEWADGMHQDERELFLHAIEKRSQLTSDMIQWITLITKMLIAVSNAAACDGATKEKLRENAARLVKVLSSVPDDEETVKFVETYQMTETLFEAASDARRRGCPEISDDIGKMLLSWMFRAGRYQTGWAILEKSVYGVSTLALLADDADAGTRLKVEVTSRMKAGGLPNKELRDSAAIKIRGRAATLHYRGHFSDAIENGMTQCDPIRLQPLLEEIADIISPETAGHAR